MRARLGGDADHVVADAYCQAAAHLGDDLEAPMEKAQGLVLRSSDRKWTRPLTLLINNRSFSDAEIFPNAVRTLGLGKLPY